MTSTQTITIGYLSITSDGTGTYELVSWDAGRLDVDNKFAESDFVNGGALVATRERMTTIQMVVRVQGTSLSDLTSHIEALTDLVKAFGYTVADTVAGKTYDCFPASWQRAYDPVLLEAFADQVSFMIPRNPLADLGS